MKFSTLIMNSNVFKRLRSFILFKYFLNRFNNDFSVLLDINSFNCANQELKRRSSYKIAFIIPGMEALNGGHTSILRLGTYLSELGHEIYYIPYENQEKKEMELNAKTNLFNYKGVFLEKNDIVKLNFDIGIATSWLSGYHLLAHQNNFDYKMYFVQDFEPYFFPVSDYYYLSLNTYKFGFHMVSLGKWNKDQIEDITSRDVDYIDFPVEINKYKLHNRAIKIDNEIKIAVYLKTDEKRAPFILLEQMKYLQEKMKDLGYTVILNVFGLDKLIKIPYINNLGKLKDYELVDLYQNSHFGLVASLTNISLVNYEMILSGLPVIDFIDGSAPTFFTEEEMIFIKSEIGDLFNKVHYYVNHQKELNELFNRAQNKIINEKTSWKKSAQQFNEILIKAQNILQ